MARAESISSNTTTLLRARETVPGVLPENAIWDVREPNEYDSFGASINVVARSPINSDRQRKKGTVVGFSAAGGYTSDLTATNLVEDMGAFMFAAPRDKDELQTTATLVDGYSVAAGGLPYVAGTLIFVTGSFVPSNNGLKLVGADSAANKINVAGLIATAEILTVCRVGFEFDVGDASIDVAGDFPALVSAGFDLTAFGLIPGEIAYLGGDLSANTFTSLVDRGYVRVYSVTSGAITFDKTDAVFIDDSGAGKAIRLFFGKVVKNEKVELQTLTTYALRRQLGRPIASGAGSNIVQSEVLLRSVANELTISIPEEDKITVELMYMCGDYKTFPDDSVIGGTIREVVEEDAINSTGDSMRASMIVYNGTSCPDPLFAVFQELSIAINNNVGENKAVTRMGAFALTPGSFEVSGEFTGYFVGVDGTQAVRDNADVSFLFCACKDNKGVAIDLPMLSLSTDGPVVEANEPITIEIDGQAATGKKYNREMDHTIFMVFFDYLPDAARV